MLEHIWFPKKIIRWYEKNQRNLPWRNTSDPYKIWLSEIILQQTRVNQGLPYYQRFVEQYPDVHALANASEEEVLRLWQGLGYYSRARNLHRCAKIVSEQKSGIFPNTSGELIDLPGIGPYTAAAIASFAHNERVAVVDGNVLRVLSRVFGIKDDIRKSHKNFTRLANELIPADQPATFNQAIMEFGARQCTPGLPDCSACPLRENCYAFKFEEQTVLPVKSKLKKIRHRYIQYIVMQRGNELLMRAREAGDIWQGLYDFPSFESDSFLEQESLLHKIQESMPGSFIVEESTGVYEHVLSHQKIHAKFIKLRLDNTAVIPENLTGADEEKRDKLPKPVLISRYLNDHNF